MCAIQKCACGRSDSEIYRPRTNILAPLKSTETSTKSRHCSDSTTIIRATKTTRMHAHG